MTDNKQDALILSKVAIHLNGKLLLSVDKEIGRGEVLSIMGPSGSGKSSLLAFIGGFLDPVFKAEGEVLNGQEVLNRIPAAERKVGMMFQDPLLFPHMSVGQNLLFAISSKVAADKKQRLALVKEALELLGLPEYLIAIQQLYLGVKNHELP